MSKFIGVEKARTKLGKLVEQVATDGEPIFLTKRGGPLAVIVSREEYERLTEATRKQAAEDLEQHLARVRKKVRKSGLKPDVVDEAIAAARKLI